MTEFSRSLVEYFKSVQKAEPGFRLHPAFSRVKKLMLGLASTKFAPQAEKKLKQEWDDAERELFGGTYDAPARCRERLLPFVSNSDTRVPLSGNRKKLQKACGCILRVLRHLHK
jgi:hypothetical protein